MGAKRPNSKNKQASAETLLGFAFIFVDRAMERSDMRPNVVLEYLFWSAAVALFLHAFWICSWTSKWRRNPKIGTILIVVLFLICANWQRVRDKWIAQHAPPPRDIASDTYDVVTNLAANTDQIRLKKTALNFAQTLDDFSSNWTNNTPPYDTVDHYSTFSQNFEQDLWNLRSKFRDAGIFSTEFNKLCEFPSEYNDPNTFSKTNVQKITKEIRRLADKS